VYVGPALRHPDAPREARTEDRHTICTRWVWADFDDEGALETALARFDAIDAAPNWVTLTGEIPHRRGQCFWRLDDDAPLEQHRLLLSDICARFGGDKSVVNPGRVMRIAGSLAWPCKPGRVLERTGALNDHTRHASYSFATLAKTLSPGRAPGQGAPHGHGAPPPVYRPFEPIRGTDAYARAVLERELAAVASAGKGTRNMALFRAAARLGELAAAAMVPAETVAAGLLAAAEASGLIRDDGRRAAEATIASGLRRGFENPSPNLGGRGYAR
jgi:hypothetical protein